MNLYTYVGNNPLNATDPMGLEDKQPPPDEEKKDPEVTRACKGSTNCQVYHPNGTPEARAAAKTDAAAKSDRITRSVPDTWEEGDARTPVGEDGIPNMGRAVLTAGGEQETSELNFAALGAEMENYQTGMYVAGGMMVGGSVIAVSGEVLAAAGTVSAAASRTWSRLPTNTRADIVSLILRVIGAGDGARAPRVPGPVPKPPTTVSQPRTDGPPLPPDVTFR